MTSDLANVAHVFATMTARFRPEGADGRTSTIGYLISGTGGGAFRVSIAPAGARVETLAAGADPGACDLRIATDSETFLGLALGTVDATAAFMSGKVKLEGDMGLATRLPRLFQKYVPPAPPTAAVTPREIVATLPARFRPDRAADLAATIGYEITGDGGGSWTATVANGSCTLSDGIPEDVTVRQTASALDFVDLVLGKLDPMVAFASGRLRVTGDTDVAQRIPRIFARFAPMEAPAEQELIVLKRNISIGMTYATGPVMGEFLEALMEKKILANVCPRCGRKQLPPREVCAECRCRADELVEVGPEGVLVFIDVIYYSSPDPLTGRTRPTPYGDIRVLLDGCRGRDTFWHLLKPGDLDGVKYGDRLRPVWAERRTGSIEDILYFEKVG